MKICHLATLYIWFYVRSNAGIQFADRQNVDKMLTKCQQNVDKMSTKCRQNVDKMSTNCQQNVDKMLSKC
jgi:hypothetical protein